MAKTARERLDAKKDPKVVVLDKDFAGVRKGQKLFVATPKIVDDYIRKIPFGETRTIEKMRGDLARRRKCDATCPVSTAIFVRISAQAALDELEQGATVEEVAPFWRLLTAKDKITGRLNVEPEWLDVQRGLERGSA